MSLPSTSNRSLNAPSPAVVGHLIVNAGCRARVLPTRPLKALHQRKRTLVQAIAQEEVPYDYCKVVASARHFAQDGMHP